MPPSDSKIPESETLAKPTDQPIETDLPESQKPQVDAIPNSGGPGEEGKDGKGQEEDEEGEGECGFCLFMKAGGCKDSFIAWEQCIEEAEKNNEDIVENCFNATGNLKKCMKAHADYYEPILKAEEEGNEELEKEALSQNVGS